MKLAINFPAKQQFGRLIIKDEEMFKQQLALFGDKDLVVTIKPFRANRSNQENRYYWSVVVGMIAEEMGFIEMEQCHEFLKEKLLRETVYVNIKGAMKEISMPMSSANLTVSQFEEYLSKCRMWASQEMSLYIPLPNEAEAY